ncbi:MAG TPA: hypothetical protein PLA18_01115 [Deltaproteobacteria bacterium]|jgi:hypothetical protein|nr:hypothetical protein [Deltaproteobacteria bacterium]
MKRHFIAFCALLLLWSTIPTAGYGAYHHQGEYDSPAFLEVYPDKAQTKLDSCALCHKGGTMGTKTYGSCQYCHAVYDFTAEPNAHGDMGTTLNSYGEAYRTAGRNATALSAIEDYDSDDDGYTNIVEILANRYPGDATDDPTKIPAPSRIYTKGQLEAMPLHTQFMLMNATRQNDNYVEYTGVPMKYLLDDAGIDLDAATSVIVYSPDGFSYTHPLNAPSDWTEGWEPDWENGEEILYHVYGNLPGLDIQYPASVYYYDTDASGWCEYTAPSCVGRNNGDSITVEGGLMAILAVKREGADLDVGVLNSENKLDGEGPFRVVVPQLIPNHPDQPKTSSNPDQVWPFEDYFDHNAGACSRTATIIKVLPLPEGTTDINTYEAGWSYVDSGKIVIYGAIDDGDQNGNGILDSEEYVEGTTYYQNPAAAYPRNAKGLDHVLILTSDGSMANVQVMTEDDPTISQTGRPSGTEFPYGAFKFTVTDIDPGAEVTISITFPDEVPAGSKYYKLSQTGGAWTEVPYTLSEDGKTITFTLTDGGALDADGEENGSILDPGTLGVPSKSGDNTDSDSHDSDSDWCFIGAASSPSLNSMLPVISLILIPFTAVWFRKKSDRGE